MSRARAARHRTPARGRAAPAAPRPRRSSRDEHPEHHLRRARPRDDRRGDEGADRPPAAEHARERRQCSRPHLLGHVAREERVACEPEHRRRESEQEHADAEGEPVGEASAMSTPMTASIDAPIMAFRSPMRATSHPAGRSPASSPTMSMAAMSPARASEAPRSVATTGMTGMIAPSPIENSSVGRYAGRMIERHENGGVASVIASTLHPARESRGVRRRRVGHARCRSRCPRSNVGGLGERSVGPLPPVAEPHRAELHADRLLDVALGRARRRPPR